jgi:flagellar FliJ protein
MPHFEFRLEGVLRHRQNIERNCQRDLAVVQSHMQQLQGELKALDAVSQQATSDLRGSRLTGRLDMNFLAAHRRFMAASQRKAMGLVQKMALVQRQIDEARGKLMEAAKQRKIMQKLREKRLARWLEDQQRHEAAGLDEVGMQISYRQLSDRADELEGAL